MTDDMLTRAWAGLLALSAVTALISALADASWVGPALSALVLLPALLKARIILADYLGLRAAPGWQRGTMIVISLFTLTALVLYLAPAWVG